jgi:hypothetical protein
MEAQEGLSGEPGEIDQTRGLEGRETTDEPEADADDLGWPSEWLEGADPGMDPWDSATLQPDLSDPPGAGVEDDSTSWHETPVSAEEVPDQAISRNGGASTVHRAGEVADRPPDGPPPGQGLVTPDPQHRDDVLLTRTLGEIYLRQGLLEKARAVFRELLARDSSDEELRARLAEVEARIPGGGPYPVVPIQDLSLRETVPIGSLAPERLPDDEPDSPPVIVSVASLAPEDFEAIDGSPPLRVVPVESLAPAPWSEARSMADADAVPIDELAPSVVVPIADLAPDDLGVEFSPPQEDNAEIEAEKKRILDEFENWLDTLP